MSEEDEMEIPVNEGVEDEVEQAVPEVRQVPLQALEAERRKRQELEAQLRNLQQAQAHAESQQQDDEDDDEFITKAEMKERLKQASLGNRRQILEESFVESNPKALEVINKHLDEILKRKPWLTQTIETAPNRYARAYEIVQDYMPKEEPTDRFKNQKTDAQRIVENSKKPGSPVTVAKGSQANNADYLHSIRGKPEFREYRRNLLAGK